MSRLFNIKIFNWTILHSACEHQVGRIVQGMLQLHSHKPPILHRDLKSPNLLVDKHWRVKVADFNLSRVMEAQAVVSSISANNPRWAQHQ